MTIEPWADAQLSEDIPRLAQGGESETVEFKRELPKQVRDLAKEIAAFASSSGGRLLLGVADDGSIPGVFTVKVRSANAGYMLRRWNVDCSPDHHLQGLEYALWLQDPLSLYGSSNATIAPGYEPPRIQLVERRTDGQATEAP